MSDVRSEADLALRRFLRILMSIVMIMVVGMLLLELQVQDLQSRRPVVVKIERIVEHVPAPVVTTASTCGAVACIRVPNIDGGLAGLGVRITGSGPGYGGTSLEFDDYEHAPEGWFRNGNWYVLAKAHWEGGGYCIINGVKDNPDTWQKACLTFWRLKHIIRLLDSPKIQALLRGVLH